MRTQNITKKSLNKFKRSLVFRIFR